MNIGCRIIVKFYISYDSGHNFASFFTNFYMNSVRHRTVMMLVQIF